MRIVAAVVALVACVHAGIWALLQRQYSVADIDGQLASVSYSPYARSQHPDYGDRPTAEQIRADLKLLSSYTRTIRTYSSTGGVELVPGIAAEFGLKVTVGIWIDKNEARNEREIQSALALAKRYSNVNAIVVGNETTLRAEKTIPELVKIIQRVKRHSPVPVTTGEIWTVWIDHPELASAVDFIAAHILPYWEGVYPSQAVDQAIMAYDKLRRAHPGKRIVIAEFGWPSAGYNMHHSDPGRTEQATIIRDFVARADAYGIDYNLIEAFDQPWKTNEGGVGMYWGLFDASRQPKFSWIGPVSDPDYIKVAGLRHAARPAALVDDPGQAARHRRRGRDARDRHQCGRRLGRDRLCLLERTLLRLRRLFRVGSRPAAADTADRDRARAHRRAGGDRVRPETAPHIAAARRTDCERGGAESVDPRPGLSRAAGHAEGDARCGRAPRISELRVRRRDQQHAGPELLAADRGALPRARRAFQVHQCGQRRRLQGRRAAACARAYRR